MPFHNGKSYYKIEDGCGYTVEEWEAIQKNPDQKMFLGTKLFFNIPLLEVTIIEQGW